MSTIENCKSIAQIILEKKLKWSTQLKQELDENLKAVDNNTNGEIYELWNELEQMYNTHQNKNESEPKPKPTTPNTNKKKRTRGRKRKYENNNTNTNNNSNSKEENNEMEPPKKRSKMSTTTSNSKKKSNFRGRASASASSSIISSVKTKKHHKLTIRTTTNNNITNGHNNSNTDTDNTTDESDNYLYKMLKNIEKAKELTDNNINMLSKSIHSIDVFNDILEQDILELGDHLRKTFPEFPFKTITPSYHQKMLQEELRLTRLLSQYPNIKQTELDIYKLQSNYVSQYKIKNNDESPNDDHDEHEYELRSKYDRNHNKNKEENDDTSEQESESEKEQIINVRNNNLSDSDDESNKWCVCEKASNGKMIRCDNTLCSIQWFHWKCVRIMKTPKDKWYCKSCRKYPTKSNLCHPKFATK